MRLRWQARQSVKQSVVTVAKVVERVERSLVQMIHETSRRWVIGSGRMIDSAASNGSESPLRLALLLALECILRCSGPQTRKRTR